MDDNAPTYGKAVKVFSGTVPKSRMPEVKFDHDPPQFKECHLQPVPKTFKLYSIEVEDADGNPMPYFAHPTGPLPPFNWVEPAH
jgi:hypothetical protein